MAIPVLQSKGTASQSNYNACDGFANPQPSFPASLASGDLILLLVCGSCSAGSADTVNATGFTQIFSDGGGTTRLREAWYKISDGTETGNFTGCTVTFTSPTTGRGHAQLYRITGNHTTSPIEGVGGSASGSGTSVNMPSVTTSTANSLACAAVFLNTNTSIGSSTGESGGDWTESASVAEDGAASGTIQLQTAGIATPTTISGGTATAGVSTTFKTFGFAIKEVAQAAAFPFFKPPMLAHHIFR